MYNREALYEYLNINIKLTYYSTRKVENCIAGKVTGVTKHYFIFMNMDDMEIPLKYNQIKKIMKLKNPLVEEGD